MLPRHDVPRDPALYSDGALVRRFAIARGRPLIPWQAHAADVIGQRIPDPDLPGGWRYRYPVAVIAVPRQCGKTSLAFDIALGRGLHEPDYRAAYTAQTGTVVTDRFGEQRLEIASSRLAPFMALRASAGTERISILPRSSYVKAFPPKDGALRGSALDLVVVDEAQEHEAGLGDALDATIIPTFTTRPRRQLLLFATAGTDSSGYLRRYRDLGLAGEIALLEYGALPGEDPLSPAIWSARHPGLGTLTDLGALEIALRTLGPDAFRREYLNLWTSGAVRLISSELWSAAQDPALSRPRRITLGVDASPDRERAAVAGSWLDDAGRVCLAVLWSGRADHLRTAADRISSELSAPVAFDHYSAGPTAHRATSWHSISARDLASASALILQSANTQTLRVAPDEELTAAIMGAAIRDVGSGGGFTFTRRASSRVNLTPLMAAVIATAGRLGAPAEPLLLA